MHSLLEKTRRVVIKLGTGLLTTEEGSINVERINGICRQVNLLRSRGLQVILVSSGSVGLGMSKLGYGKRPSDLTGLQACAAVGQSILTDTWQNGFDPFEIIVAQLLLTREDVRGRKRHVAIKNLFEKLLASKVVPVVNENDSVSVEELRYRFGDNDILSAMVGSLVKAEMLVILTTIKGLMDLKGSNRIVPVVEKITPEIEEMADGTNSATSVGGMKTKVEAAKIATKSGCGVFLGCGKNPEILENLFRGKAEGTFFIPRKIPLVSKKRWLAFFEHPEGSVMADEGACEALLHHGGSLLPKGITGYEGDFRAGDVINIQQPDGVDFARGVSQFDSADLALVAGRNTEQIRSLFPGRKRLEVVHRDSLVMFV